MPRGREGACPRGREGGRVRAPVGGRVRAPVDGRVRAPGMGGALSQVITLSERFDHKLMEFCCFLLLSL